MAELDITSARSLIPQSVPSPLRLSEMMREILRLAVPSFVSFIVCCACGMGTYAVVRVLQPEYIGAMGLGSTIIGVLSGCPLYAIQSGLDTLIPQSFGKGDRKMCGVYANRGITVLSLLGIPLYLAVCCSHFFVVNMCGIAEDMAGLSIKYAIYLIPNMMLAIVAACLGSFMLGQRVVIPGMIIGCATSSLYPLWLLVFVRWLGCGYLGAAYAQAINAAAGLAAAIVYIYRSGTFKDSLASWGAEVFQGWSGFFSVCGYSGLMSCLMGWSYHMLSIFAGRLSKDELAAHVALLNIISWLYAFPVGFGTAVTVIVGNKLGERKSGEAKAYAKLCVAVNFGLSVVTEILALLFRSHLGALFTTDPQVQSYISSVVPYAVLLNVFDVNQGILARIIYGLGKQKNASFVLMVTHWVLRVPLAWVLTFTLGFGLEGLWTAYIFSLAGAMIGFGYVVVREDWEAIAQEVYERIEKDKAATKS